MAGNYYFYIVNRFDSLVYEYEMIKVKNETKVMKKWFFLKTLKYIIENIRRKKHHTSISSLLMRLWIFWMKNCQPKLTTCTFLTLTGSMSGMFHAMWRRVSLDSLSYMMQRMRRASKDFARRSMKIISKLVDPCIFNIHLDFLKNF